MSLIQTDIMLVRRDCNCPTQSNRPVGRQFSGWRFDRGCGYGCDCTYGEVDVVGNTVESKK